MKRVRIIANKPPLNDGYYSDISKYIGREYIVLESFDDGTVGIIINDNELIDLYPDEYEVIE